MLSHLKKITKNTCWITAGVFFLLFGAVNAQEMTPCQENASVFIAKADEFTGVRRDSAFFYLDKAIGISQKCDDLHFSYFIRTIAIRMSLFFHDYLKARNDFEAFEKDLAKNKSKFSKEDYDDILKEMYFSKGNYALELYDYTKAEEYYNKVTAMNDPKSTDYMTALLATVNAMIEAGKLNEAEATISKLQKMTAFNSYQTYYLQLLEINLLFKKEENKTVITKAKKAIESFSKALKPVEESVCLEICKKASKSALAINVPDSALYFLEATKTYEINKDKNKSIDLQFSYGDIYEAKGDYKTAEEYYLNGLAQADDFYKKGTRNSQRAYGCGLISRMYNKMGRYEDALVYIQYGLLNCTETFKPRRNLYKNPDAKDIVYKHFGAVLLENKVTALEGLYKKTNRSKFLLRAFETQQISSKLADLSYMDYDADTGSGAWATQMRSTYETGIKHFSLWQDLSGEKTSYFYEQMFKCSEAHKSGLQLDALKGGGFMSISGMPDSLGHLQKYLRSERDVVRKKLFEIENDPEQVANPMAADYTRQLVYLNGRLDTLENSLKSNYPEYTRLFDKVKIAKLADLKEKLGDKNSAMIEYFQGENVLYAFVITASKNFVLAKKLPFDYKEKINNFRNLINTSYIESNNQSNVVTQYSRQSAELYELLLKDPLEKIGKEADRLIFVTDGVLSYLPFDVLLTQPVKEHESFGDFHYLLRDYAVTYSSSASSWMLQCDNPRTTAFENDFIGFAPEYKSNQVAELRDSVVTSRSWRRNKLSALPGAKLELERVSNVIGNTGKSLYNQEASERNFKKYVANTRILHLSMHALLEESYPMYSGLLFTNVQDSVEDNDLTASELYSMHIPAELAVLSACNTGMDRDVRSGEGINGLARAFIFSGCRSTVMSLWEVSDECSAQIMESFYKELKRGVPKDLAMRKAKLTFLDTQSNAITMNPFFWSPFVVTGDSRPLYPAGGNARFWVSLVGLIGLAFGCRSIFR